MLQHKVQRETTMPWGRGLVRGWIWIVNIALLIYAGLPWLSPLLRSLGFERAGLAIFRMYSQFCHQLPERGFTLNGYPVCYCHRCTALYTGLLAIGLVFAFVRWRMAISRRVLLLLTLPIVIDGTWHLLNDVLPGIVLRSAESGVDSLNFWLRLITGVLFAFGVGLWAFPRVDRELQAA